MEKQNQTRLYDVHNHKKFICCKNTKIADYQKLQLVFATCVSISVFIGILVTITEIEYLRLQQLFIGVQKQSPGGVQ